MAEQNNVAKQLSPETIEQIGQVVRRYPSPRSAIMPALYLAQADAGYLTAQAMTVVAEAVGISPAEVEEVASFYTMYYFKPVGRNILKVCTSISCYLVGSDQVVAELEQQLGIKAGENTADGNIRLERAECLAACGQGPTGQLNDQFLGKLTAERIAALVQELQGVW